jgi:hypothetical protein
MYIETVEDRLTVVQTKSDYDAYYNETELADLDEDELDEGSRWWLEHTDTPDYM